MDYQELKRLQQEYARLTDLNENQTEQMRGFFDQLAEPSVWERIFIADALIGGQPVAVSSGGCGGNSDLRLDGHRPDEEEAYRKRCFMLAIGVVTGNGGKKKLQKENIENISFVVSFY